ncbi:MAG TPA: hypothetical protein VD996_17240, partial [Chitinophagaceae bacterium]|nr:hypothetical protein [Chitinophagaceae bacterium]
AFEKVVEHFGNGAFSMVLRVHRSGGLSLVQRFGSLVNSYSAYSEVERFYLQHRIDAWAMLEYHAGILASLLNLYKSHPDFYNLPLQDQCTVIRNVFGILGDAVFRSDNPKSPVVARYDQLLVDLGAMDDVAARISMADVQDCLQEAVLGAVMNSFQTIRQLWQVINGYNLGWDGILHVARSALKTIVGSSVGGALVGFGLCIAWEYFW